jgi:hypothetical protein
VRRTPGCSGREAWPEARLGAVLVNAKMKPARGECKVCWLSILHAPDATAERALIERNANTTQTRTRARDREVHGDVTSRHRRPAGHPPRAGRARRRLLEGRRPARPSHRPRLPSYVAAAHLARSGARTAAALPPPCQHQHRASAATPPLPRRSAAPLPLPHRTAAPHRRTAAPLPHCCPRRYKSLCRRTR